MATHSIAELRSMTDEQLIEIYDSKAKTTEVGTRFYLEELSRREQDRHSAQMLQYTKSVTTMTIVMMVATLVNLLIAVAAAYFAYKAVYRQ